MRVPMQCVIDTVILQSANAELTVQPKKSALINKRFELLERIGKRELIALVSERLINEYQNHLREPRNTYIRAFLELLVRPDGTKIKFNWKKRWPTSDQEIARNCGFPKHDDHLLRTAILADGVKSSILTEEQKLISTDKCIHRTFRVHIHMP